MLSMRDFSKKYRNSKSAHLPSSLKKPELRTTHPPVEVWYKSETRSKELVTIDMLDKCAAVQPRAFSDVYGDGHLQSRFKTARVIAAIREDRPKVFPVEFSVGVWNRTNYDFPDAASLRMVRRIIRIAPPGAKRDKVSRPAWIPTPEGSPLRHPT